MSYKEKFEELIKEADENISLEVHDVGESYLVFKRGESTFEIIKYDDGDHGFQNFNITEFYLSLEQILFMTKWLQINKIWKRV